MSESAAGRAARPKKKRPNAFANTFASVISGADEVVEASFIASGAAHHEDTAPGPGAAAVVAPRADPPAAAPTVQAEELADTGIDPASEASVPEPVVSTARVASTPPAPEERARPALPQVERASVQEVPRAPARPAAESEHTTTGGQPLAAAPTLHPVAGTSERGTEKAAGEPDSAASGELLSAPVRRRAAGGRRASQAWAHQALFESFTSAAIDSKSWTMHGFRLLPDVLAALKARMAADRRTSGNQKLAISHYLDAALRHAPSEVEEQIASAQAFLAERMGMVEAGRQSTYRVGPQASAMMSGLNTALQEADHGRKGIYVVNAALQSFLQSLDAAGELKRPELPGAR